MRIREMQDFREVYVEAYSKDTLPPSGSFHVRKAVGPIMDIHTGKLAILLKK